MAPLGRARYAVDGDAFGLEVLRWHLPGSVTVARLRSEDFLQHLPWVQPRLVPGTDQPRNSRFLTRFEIAVETWHSSARAAADLADQVTVAFDLAARSRQRFAGAGLARLAVTGLPAEIRDADQLGELFHWTATYLVDVRPA